MDMRRWIARRREELQEAIAEDPAIGQDESTSTLLEEAREAGLRPPTPEEQLFWLLLLGPDRTHEVSNGGS